MSDLTLGALYGVVTLVVMFSGMPIAFALGVVAAGFMYFFMPASSLDTITQNVYEEMASITLLSIPLFILKGSAIGKSPAGRDLYAAIHAWLHKVPGGLGIANVFACALFAAMAGSSPATCSAIGSAGIPEMRRRGYSPGFAAGIIAAGGTLGILLPPSITMILYAVAAEQSLGRLFLAGIGPGVLLVGLFAGYAVYRARKEYALAKTIYEGGGVKSAYLDTEHFTLADKVEMLPRVLPFLILLIGVMVALYGGFATPSETAGLGALLALLLIAIVYGVWRPKDLAPILSSTIKESTMLLLIIGMSLFYSYVMSYLHISQSAAQFVVDMHLSRWLLLAVILAMVIVFGFFLPPVSIILMTAPIILPPLKAAGFDLIWFGIAMTIVMEMGLIHPPVGLNIFVIKNIAPDIPLRDVILGVLPFVVLMFIAVVLLCVFPSIATALPDMLMGTKMKIWNTLQVNRAERLARAARVLGNGLAGKVVDPARVADLLHAALEPGDRVCLEGNNQKQADFLAQALANLDPARIHGLHMLQSVLALPEHLDVFERGIASKLDFSFSGPQAGRVAKLVSTGQLHIGAIHTYLELFGRYMMDIPPRVCLIAAEAADRHGNLYTGPNTEDTPAIVEATAFKNGIVIVQVNQVLDTLPRVDIPGDWVDFVVQSPQPYYIEPLFTRDPAQISDIQVLMAMMAIKGIYAEYQVERLNHGIGFDTAAIELLLPTYATQLGLKGKIARHWALNPHPALIPAIEAGFAESVYSFGSELGMEDYIRARPDVFSVGPDGSMRSNRAMCQAAGHYACDMFIGSTLQIDLEGNSSTATLGRIAGFGGAPNMGADARGRRHASPAWLKAGREARAGIDTIPRGQKLVVQIVETFREHMQPAFVDKLDAWELAEQAGFDIPPVMIYGDDVTHILTEEGIANLLLCRSPAEREQAIRGVAGYTPVGLARDKAAVEALRARGVIRRAEDLGIDKRLATRDLLAAKNMKDLVRASGGLYAPPKRFRNW